MSDKQLAEVVREYLNEMGNPSPCHVMRTHLRRKMAELVGVEDPAETLRKWHEGSRKVRGGKS